MQIVRGLQMAGHRTMLLGLDGRRVVRAASVTDTSPSGHLGLSGGKPFKVVESGLRRAASVLRMPYLGLFDSYRFYEACCRNARDFDVFHERQGLMKIGGSLASKRLGTPLVLEVNADLFFEREFTGSPIQGAQKIVGAFMTRINYRTASAIVCVSEIVKRDLVARWSVPQERVWVLPNAVDVSAFGESADSRNVRLPLGLKDGPLVVFVGSFYPWHDLDLLVDSFVRVVQLRPRARLLLVGDGPNRRLLEERIGVARIRQSVVLTGSMPHEMIPHILHASDVAVAPYPKVSTGFWGSPMKIFEYMAAGKAIVASRVGQIAEVIRNGQTGLLAEPGDVQGFAQAVAHLLRDPSERARLGENARRQAVERHSWESYVERLERIYHTALGANNAEILI